MLYLIGLGLNAKGYSVEALEAVKRCKAVYLENYTVEFPYSPNELVEDFDKKIRFVDREFVEGMGLVDEAARKDVALLIYGAPLAATTHVALINECKKSQVPFKVIQGASIFDAVAETGLQLYKFGKTASMPRWQQNFKPISFLDVLQQNKTADAHTLILIDIGLGFQEALNQLSQACEKKGIKRLGKIVICQRLGLGNKSSRVFYDTIEGFKERDWKVAPPFCIIIPTKLHFLEKEFLDSL